MSGAGRGCAVGVEDGTGEPRVDGGGRRPAAGCDQLVEVFGARPGVVVAGWLPGGSRRRTGIVRGASLGGVNGDRDELGEGGLPLRVAVRPCCVRSNLRDEHLATALRAQRRLEVEARCGPGAEWVSAAALGGSRVSIESH